MHSSKYAKRVAHRLDSGKVVTHVVSKNWDDGEVRCFCSRCASPYFDFDDTKIVRADKYQLILSTCEMCGSTKGYDFVVFYPRSGRAA